MTFATCGWLGGTSASSDAFIFVRTSLSRVVRMTYPPRLISSVEMPRSLRYSTTYLQKKPASPAPIQPLGWVLSGLTMPSGARRASCACASVIICWSRIWLMTRLRRSRAASGLVTGSNDDVLRTIPASSAAWGTVSLSGVVLKYVLAAAFTP